MIPTKGRKIFTLGQFNRQFFSRSTLDNDSRAVDVSKYTKGDYFVRIVQDNKVVTASKVIKL